MALSLGAFITPAHAEVEGDPHRLYRQHQVFGGAVITGNTLMTASITAPEVNSGLLPRSGGDVNSLPFDAELVGAYLFWSGSIAAGTDRTVDLTTPDGGFFNDVQADRCVTVNRLGGFFYCRADVTERLRQRFDGGVINGQYQVGDLEAEPGLILPDGTCAPEQAAECQAKYAGWSLALIYEAESANTLRDIFIYDGFRQIDETPASPGIDTFDIDGFDMPVNGEASLTFFAMEGDAFLGVPPQDTDANPQVRCDTCFDFLEFGGTKLTNATNPPNNLFNSTSPGGFTLGLDIDTYNVSALLRSGQQRVRIRAGSGDGFVNPRNPDPGGGGEMFILGYVQLTVDRNAPNFRRAGTQLSVVPDEAAPLERVVFTLRIENEGTLNAENTLAQLALPDGLTYLPGSLRVDGADPIPGEEVANPLALGLNVGNIPFQGDNDRVITFRATIDQGVAAGTRLISQASISASDLDAIDSNEAVVVVLGDLALGQVSKQVVGDGDGRFVPGEAIQYIITIPNPNPRNVNDVLFVDEVPRFIDVNQVVFAGQGVNRTQGNSVRLESLVVPPGGLNIIILGSIHDTEALLADGIPPGGVNGFQISNQGQVTAAGQLILTDDPATAAENDPTRLTLSAEVDITGAGTRKVGVDVNGGLVEPGDVIEYTVTVTNTGAADASIFVDDLLPEATEACTIDPRSQGNFICINGRVQGFATVPPEGRIQLIYTVQIVDDVANGTEIRNTATIEAPIDPTQVAEVSAGALTVVSAPILDASTKTVTRADGTPLGGQALPGETLRYTLTVPNTGNRPATAVQIADSLAFDFDNVTPLDGGVFDAGANQITWNVGAVQVGAEAVVRFDATLPAVLADNTVIDNQGLVSAAELGDAVPTDDPATAAVDDPTRVVVRSQPRLLLTKSVDRAVARPGEQVTYTFTVTNTGSTEALDVSITDTLPGGVFGDIRPVGGQVVGSTVTFDGTDSADLRQLPVGASATFEVAATLQPVLAPRQVENQAIGVARNTDDPVLSDDPGTDAPSDPTIFTVQSAPVLSLTKAVEDLNGGDPQPGDRVRYVLSVENTGDAPTEGVVVTDPLPAELSDVVPGAGGRLDGGALVFEVGGDLIPGEAPSIFTFEATIAEGTPQGTQVSNQGTAAAGDISALSDDPATPAAGDPTVLVVVSRPDLSTSLKRVEPVGTVVAGQPVTYTLEVVNSGTAPATDVVVRDPLSALLGNPVAQGGQVVGGEARWTIDRLEAGASVEFTLTGLAPRPIADGTLLPNQAFLSAAELPDEVATDDPTTEAPDDPTVIIIEARPVLTATKTVRDLDGAPVRPGDVLEYTLEVRNTGGADAAGVTLTDVLDPNLTVELPGGAVVDGQTLTWDLVEVAVDTSVEQVFTARVAAPLDNGTRIENQGVVTFDDQRVLTDDPNTAPENDPTTVQVIAGADLSGSTKTVEDLNGGDVRPGDQLRYTVTVTNTGDAVARGVSVTDLLPDTLELVDAPGSIDGPDGRLWPFPAILPGGDRSIAFVAAVRPGVPDGTAIDNQAFASVEGAAEPFPTDDPNTAAVDDPTTVQVTASASLALTKQVVPVEGFPVRPGDLVDYTLRVENTGDGVSAPFEVSDVVPGELLVVDVPPPAGVINGTLRWPVGVLAPDASAVELTFRAQVRPETPDGQAVSNQAIIQLPDGTEVRSDDPSTIPQPDATSFSVVDGPDLRGATKAVDRDQVYGPGDTLIYTISVTNSGSRQATQVVITDPLPEGLTLVSSNPPAQILNGNPIWTFGTLGADETVVIEVTTAIGADVADGTSLVNQATVQAQGLPDQVTDDPSTDAVGDPTIIEVVARAVLRLTKAVEDDNGGAFNPGDAITWRLTLANDGNQATEALQVLDPIDDDLVNANAVDGQVENGVASWSLEALAPGATRELLLRARINPNAADGAEVVNQFAVSEEGSPRFLLSDDPTTPEPDDPVRFIVVRPEVSATKTVQTVGPGGFVPGAEVQYAIEITNTSETPVDRVLVSDPIDTLRLDNVVPGEGGIFDPDLGQVNWTPELFPELAVIAPGATVTLSVRARIRPLVPTGEVVSNQGLVDVGGVGRITPTDDPTTPAAGDPTDFVVSAPPQLAFIKQILGPPSGERVPGAVVTYQLIVQNVGVEPVFDPIFTDNLPPQVDYVPESTRLDGVPFSDIFGAPPFGPGMLLAIDGDPPALQPGTSTAITFDVRVRPDAPVGSEVLNQGSITDASDTITLSDDPTTAARPDPTGFIIDGGPQLSRFVKTWRLENDPDRREALVGDVIRWRLEVSNLGLGEARSVRINDPFPDGVRYVEGSISADGVPQTDALDADNAAVFNGQLVADFGDVPGGETRSLEFLTEVTEARDVVNQARAQAVGFDLLSDADDDPINGIQPTVVPVGEIPVRQAEIFKRVVGLEGNQVDIGEPVRFEIIVRNTGTEDLSQVQVFDDLPQSLLFEGFDGVPPGGRTQFDRPPAGALAGGQAQVILETLQVGQEVQFFIDTRVDPALDGSRQICNEARVDLRDLDPVNSPRACITAELRLGAVEGVVFQELDTEQGFQVEGDEAFADMRVAVYPMSDPDGEAAAEAITDAEGRFELPELRPGAYRVRVFTSSNVLFKIIDDVEVSGGETLSADLAIDPSGRVYNSVDGDLIDGAEIFIYRDEDLEDDDVLDAESLSRRVLVDPEDLEAPSQQGQRTANGGLYRFAVKVPGRYIVEVVPPGQSFVSPSVLVPATPGIATRQDVDDEGRVVPDPVPSVDPDADRTYFLGFDLQTADDLYLNNHIPVDPLSSLIDLEKRSTKPTATVGDVITYQVDIVNRSPVGLLFDPATGTGGVFLQDITPKGFKYVAGSVVFTRVDGGREIPLSADDPGPDDVNILRFGVVRQEDGRRVLRPFDLAAGEHIRVRYQMVVGANAKPKKRYTNRAVVLADGSVPVTRVARATVRVIADPIFDQGVLLGRVFCDIDGDGKQQEGERGLPGARVYMDHGWYSNTDSAGMFHFRDLDPGVHAVKIDTDTLLPGAVLTTDETRVINFTRGLPAKVSFGVTCPGESVTDPEVELDRGGMEAALEALRQQYLVVTGDVLRHTLTDGRQQLAAPEIKVKVSEKKKRRRKEKSEGGVIDLKYDSVRGRALGALVFRPTVPAGAGTDRWQLKVAAENGPWIEVKGGQGTPPRKIEWDLRGPDGRPMLTDRGVYQWRLELAAPDGQRYTSTVGRFGVGAMGPGSPELVRTLRGDLFKGRGRRLKLTEEGERLVAEVAGGLKARPGKITVEVHSAGVPGTPEAIEATGKRAALVEAAFKAQLPDPTRVSAKGRGNDVPLVPNFSRRNRRKNERVEIRIIPDGPAKPPESLVKGTPQPSWAKAHGQAATPGEDGRFALVVPVTEDGVVEVALQGPDGRRSIFVLRPAPGRQQAPLASRQLVVDGTVPDGLRIGGAVVKPRAIDVKVSAPEAAPLEGRSLKAPIPFKLKAGRAPVDQWRFILLTPSGKRLYEAAGAGRVDDEVVWSSPGDDSLSAGLYSYRLTVRYADGAVGQSAEGFLKVGKTTTSIPENKGQWGVRIDGRPMPQREVKGTTGPQIDGLVTVKGASALLVEIRRPDGGRGLFFVAPPKAPKAPDAKGADGQKSPAASKSPASPKSTAAPKSGVPQSLDPLPLREPDWDDNENKTAKKPSGLIVAPVDTLDGTAPKTTAQGEASAKDTDYKKVSTDPNGASKKPAEPEVPLAEKVKPASPKLSPAQRLAMEDFGRSELLTLLTTRTGVAGDLEIPARQLSVTLPPEGATLNSPTLPVFGRTDPQNVITLNGQPVDLDEKGNFSGVVELPIGEAKVEIVATDPGGNRGVIRRNYTVSGEQWFLLALGEGLTGSVNSELDGVYDHTRTRISDRVYLHGRAVAYLKGRMQGKDVLGGLFKQIKVTANVDTARHREYEAYFEQLIDPDTFYPVYGDSSESVRDVNARGPVYVLIEADRSTLTVGNFKTGIRGVELFNYDRTLYGAHLKLDVDTGDFRHELTAFASDDEESERHAYVELQGTGGSLYYLPHRDVVEGSERIYLIERDKISGVERRKIALSRDADYNIRYREGRILVKQPVQSSTLDVMGALPQVPSMNGNRTLDGHPVYISIEYDHRDLSNFGDQTFGVHARETWNKQITLGAGYIEEGRSDQGLPDYRLWGAELTARHGRKSFFTGELARSRSFNGENLFSDDGGLSFSPFNLRDGTDTEGSAFQLRLGVEMDDLIGEGKQDHWYTEGYWQYLSEGYYAGGTIQQQGLEKYGILSRYHIDKHHQLKVQHDGIVASEPGTQNFGVFRGFRRDVTRAGYQYTEKGLRIDGEIVRTYANEGGLLNPQSPGMPTNGVFNGDANSGLNTIATGTDDFIQPLDVYTLEVGGEYDLDDRWTLIGDQELVLRGDSRLHEDPLDLAVTTAGARYKMTESVSIEGTVSSRWSGDNAAQVGMTAEVDERHTVYVRDRRTDANGQVTHTLVMGGEERIGEKGEGRAYGEYQVENGAEGQRNRAIMGVGRRMKLVKGLHLDLGYERSQVFGASAGGQFSRDTVSLGAEWLEKKDLKLTGRYELRYEDNDEEFNRRDRSQVLALNAFSWKFQRDFSLLARLNYSHTMDLQLNGTEAELVEGTMGIAWRPVRTDWAAALLRYTKRYEQLPVQDLSAGLVTREESDVLAIIPIFELPYRLQLVEKLAYKRTASRVEAIPSVVSHTLLWINRLNFHLTDTWDIGGEYRFLQVSLAQNQQHGALFELNYIIEKRVRLGLGYNFTSFSDDEFQRLNEDHGGPFFRVIANY